VLSFFVSQTPKHPKLQKRKPTQKKHDEKMNKEIVSLLLLLWNFRILLFACFSVYVFLSFVFVFLCVFTP